MPATDRQGREGVGPAEHGSDGCKPAEPARLRRITAMTMLSAEALKEIDRAIAKYPADQKQSAVMAALAVAQGEVGWVSPKSCSSSPATSKCRRVGGRGGHVLQHVRHQAGGQAQDHRLYQPAVRAVGRRAGWRIPEAQAGIDYNETTADGCSR
jgi:NADH-quinone oxidoreductase subunit E